MNTNQESKPAVKRVALYARKSSAFGEEAQIYNSIDAQLDMCRAYVKLRELKGWTIVAEYSDMGVSGKNLDRPGFQQLLAAARAHEIDVIVAYRLDRISRTMLDYLNLLKELNELGISIALSAQNLDTSTIDGRLNANIRLSFAEYERELDSMRIREKLAATAERGIFVGGVAPYGYERRGKEGLFVDETTAPIVREIYERYTAGELRSSIADDLNRRGIALPVKNGKVANANDRQWEAGRITRLLERPIYKGHIVFKGSTYPGRHTALVSEEMWQAAQDRMKAEKKTRAEGKITRRLVYPLKGILRCPLCGSRLVGVYVSKGPKRTIRYYACPHHRGTRFKTKCEYQGISAVAIEEAMLTKLTDLSNEEQLINALCEALPGLKRRDLAKALSRAETLGQFMKPEQLSALYSLVFKSAVYDRDKRILITERYVL